ncbi:MAG: carbohydrate kinase family protein [Kineosporiaceae bacterium]
MVCAGGCVIDRKLKLNAPVVAGTSNPARAVTSFGGVARNVAETLARLGTEVALISRVGDDDAGRAVTAHLAGLGVDVRPVGVAWAGETAQYVALLDPDGELVVAAAAMDVLDGLAPDDLDLSWPGRGTRRDEAPTWLFADCNLPIDTLAHAVRRARAEGTRLAVDAVSTPKVGRLPRDLTGIDVLFCNDDEAYALAAHHGWPMTGNVLDLAQLLHEHGARHVVLSRGPDGVVVADSEGTRLHAATAASVYDVTGAGDALVAGTLTLLVTGAGLDDAVLAGTLVAALTVESQYSVRPDLSAELVDAAALHRLRRPGLIAASRATAEDAVRVEENG